MSAGFQPARPTGSDPEARFMQWVWDRLTRLKFISTPSVTFEELTNGIRAEARGGSAAGAASPRRYRIKGWDDEDAWRCRTWDGAVEGSEDVWIARPKLLRCPAERTIGDVLYEYTYIEDFRERTATWGEPEESESQVIVPHVEVDDELWAVTAATGVVVLKDDHPELDEDIDVSLLDLNVDGRAWAATA